MQIHLAPAGLEDVVQQELGSSLQERHGRLFYVPDGRGCHFAQNTWFDVKEFEFQSISQAAKHLRAIQRNWWLHEPAQHRGRARLIQEQLPPLKPKLLAFPPMPLPSAPMGSWTLRDERTMVFAAQCSSPFGDGEIEFAENKTEPPSRAYLKLWEIFTLTQKWPRAGERVLDLGSSPGGWTWVLDQLGAQVISVDKAPLAQDLKLSPAVEFRNESAFGLDPKSVGKVDWLFSDIICYPERLLELIRSWEPHASNMVCTIKFQGPTDFDHLEEFLRFSGVQVRHLFNNKHELTWTRLA